MQALYTYNIDEDKIAFSFLPPEAISKIEGLPLEAIIGFCISEDGQTMPTNKTFRSHRPFKDLMHRTISSSAPQTRKMQAAVEEGVKIKGGKEFYIYVIDRRCEGCSMWEAPPYVICDHPPSSDDRNPNIIGSFRVNNKVIVADSYQSREQHSQTNSIFQHREPMGSQHHLLYVDEFRDGDFFVKGGFFQLLPEISEALIEAFCAGLQHSVEAEVVMSVKAGLLARSRRSLGYSQDTRTDGDQEIVGKPETENVDANSTTDSSGAGIRAGVQQQSEAEAESTSASQSQLSKSDAPWHHTKELDQAECTRLVDAHPDGTFVISHRLNKKTGAAEHAMCLKYNGKATFYKIAKAADGVYEVTGKRYGLNAKTIDELVEALSQDALPAGWPIKLGNGINKSGAIVSRTGGAPAPPPVVEADDSQEWPSSAAAVADPAKKPGFHIVPVEPELFMSFRQLLAPAACSEATDPDHPSEYCSKCMDYADALRVAVETLEEMPMYTCYVERFGQCLTFLSNADFEEMGFFPMAGIIGVLNSHPEHKTSFGAIGKSGSETNPSFTEVMHHAIAAAGTPDRHIAAGAPKNGDEEGWVYIIDPRTPTPEGSVPPSDILGSFKVDCETQTVVKESYRPNENYQLLSGQGHGLCQLPGNYYTAIIQAIKACTGGAVVVALADGSYLHG